MAAKEARRQRGFSADAALFATVAVKHFTFSPAYRDPSVENGCVLPGCLEKVRSEKGCVLRSLGRNSGCF